MKLPSPQWRHAIAVFALLLLHAPLHAQSTSRPASDSTPTVVEVRLIDEGGKALGKVPDNLAIQVGSPLEQRRVADSLRALYRTGDYADLRAVVAPVEGGVRLDFVALQNFFFGEVRMEGLTPPPSEASASAAM